MSPGGLPVVVSFGPGLHPFVTLCHWNLVPTLVLAKEKVGALFTYKKLAFLPPNLQPSICPLSPTSISSHPRGTHHTQSLANQIAFMSTYTNEQLQTMIDEGLSCTQTLRPSYEQMKTTLEGTPHSFSYYPPLHSNPTQNSPKFGIRSRPRLLSLFRQNPPRDPRVSER